MDQSVPPTPPTEATDRRTFLGRATATATIAFAWPTGVPGLDLLRLKPTAPGAPRRALTALEWRTLEAAVAQVLPSAKDTPGAAEVNAVGWIDALMADEEIEGEAKTRVRWGASRLHGFAKQRGAVEYARLPAADQHAGLRLFEGDWESQLFLRGLIAWTLEAFLGDPVHGVNPDQVGWRWARRRPGYPRPTEGWRPLGDGPSERDR